MKKRYRKLFRGNFWIEKGRVVTALKTLFYKLLIWKTVRPFSLVFKEKVAMCG
ncbi:MAG: hypothetical protein IPL65_14535 [Lewinellaceae bacterium]|nr:hypothetical protein [Lewinellaceae bacterium]